MHRQFWLILILSVGLWPHDVAAETQAPIAAWVQMAPGQASEARAVISGKACPGATIDGHQAPMRLRAAAGSLFPHALCAVTLPSHLRQLAILGHALPIPKVAPERIVILGDTGCRIKGLVMQACNDPAKWPFPRVAALAAATKPDLIIHVGDYLYRESPCRLALAGCGGSPSGDRWESWKADFFDPAAPLLAAAPFVFVRGNHEECARSGAGWLRLLGPLNFDPVQPCTDHIAPYGVGLGAATLAVVDDAHAPDIAAPGDLINLYRADFAALHLLSPGPIILAMHRPVWGVVSFGFGIVVGGNRTMMAAQDDAGGIPSNVILMLAGHIHTFEAINYAKGAPPQIIAGEGGDLLDQAPRDLSGRHVGALKIASGLSLPGYGFLVMTRSDPGWAIDVMGLDGKREERCMLRDRRLDCRAS
ncbi:MAG TPA: metallophosphoesterase [Rhizomicrobium sp.]|jgi:hypothetical protein